METVQILSSGSLEAISRAEVDIQIETAKRYPRNLPDVLNRIATLASHDMKTAEECFYVLRRGKGDDQKTIEGLSVRFAEIIASAWGNLRVATRIIGNDGKMITAQGVCHDLENNVATSVEVHRRITDKFGRTYSDDMVVVTGNAASAIAYRNAVLKVIPKAITKDIVENVRKIALGKALDIPQAWARAVENFKTVGVTDKMLLKYLEVKSVPEVNVEHMMTLRGLWTAIKEGDTTVTEAFSDIDPNAAAETEKKVAEVKDKIAEAKQTTTTNGNNSTENNSGEPGKLAL